MPITVNCICAKSEDVPDSFAGTRVCCRTCGARMRISEVIHASWNEDSGSILNYASVPQDTSPVVRERQVVGRSCIMAGAFLVAVSLVFLLPIIAISWRGDFTGIMMCMFFFGVIGGPGVLQFLGGISIRQGGTRLISTCSILALFQFAFSLFGCLWCLVALTKSGSVLVLLPVSFFGFAAFVFFRMVQSLHKISA